MYRRCHLHWRACNLYFIYATIQSCKTYQEPSSSAGGPCVRKGSCAGSNENCGAYCKPKRAMQNEVSYAIKLVFQMCRLQLKANKQKHDRKVKQECFIISCHAIVTWDPTKFLSDYNQVCLNNRVNHLII